MRRFIRPYGTRALPAPPFPSDESLGYFHSVPTGRLCGMPKAAARPWSWLTPGATGGLPASVGGRSSGRAIRPDGTVKRQLGRDPTPPRPDCVRPWPRAEAEARARVSRSHTGGPRRMPARLGPKLTASRWRFPRWRVGLCWPPHGLTASDRASLIIAAASTWGWTTYSRTSLSGYQTKTADMSTTGEDRG